MLWNYFGKPDDDLHDLNLGNFFLIQFHAPAQEYVIVFKVIQISTSSLPNLNWTKLTLYVKQAILGHNIRDSASSNTIAVQ